MSEMKFYRYFFNSRDEDGGVTPGLVELDPILYPDKERFFEALKLPKRMDPSENDIAPNSPFTEDDVCYLTQEEYDDLYSDKAFMKGITGPDQITDDVFLQGEIYYQRNYLYDFLSQTNYSYLDQYGFDRESYKMEDQFFSYTFGVRDGNFGEVLAEIGLLLQKDDLPLEVKAAGEELYNVILPIAEERVNVSDVLKSDEPEEMEERS